jgi:hypothetical protein
MDSTTTSSVPHLRLILLPPLAIALIFVIARYVGRQRAKSRDALPVLGASAGEAFSETRAKIKYIGKGYEMIFSAYEKVNYPLSHNTFANFQHRARYYYCEHRL